MPIHDIALDHEVGAPEGVQDLLPRKHAPRIRCEEIQQRLLERGEIEVVVTRHDLAVQYVDLQIADAQPRHELADVAGRSA